MGHQEEQSHSPSEAACLFTIFIPTYNRAHLLPRTLKSVEQQTCRDFEVLLIDDGSTDDTRTVVEAWAAESGLPLRYVWQDNAGKPAAHNAAVAQASGQFMVILDSDDVLAPRALELLKRRWETIPPDAREHFAGIEGLCADMQTKAVIGDRFPQPLMDSNYLETRYRLRIGGDKKNAIRTDVLRAYPFPRIDDEKHLPESVVWNRIAQHYDFRYCNDVVQYVEYHPEGLSDRIRHLRYENPKGFRLASQELLNLHADYCDRTLLYRSAMRYARYSFHAGLGLAEQWRGVSRKGVWLLALPEATFQWVKDKWRARRDD